MDMVIVNKGIGKYDGMREDEEHKACKERVSGEHQMGIQTAEIDKFEDEATNVW